MIRCKAVLFHATRPFSVSCSNTNCVSRGYTPLTALHLMPYNQENREKRYIPVIYVLSDIHGNERRFDSILKQIYLQSEDTLYILGDVIDRHPGGIRILRKIMSMPNVKMLLGTHEYMMLRALGHPYDDTWDDGRAMEHWYRNGGKVTHDSFKRIQKNLREEIINYLLNLPLNLDIKVNGIDYKLVHAAPIGEYDSDPRYKNPIHFAVWKRL